MKRKRSTKEKQLIDVSLLQIKTVPAKIITAEKVTERLTGKKIKPKYKASVKYKAAIKNFRKAVTRHKLSITLLKNHQAVLKRMVKKYE